MNFFKVKGIKDGEILDQLWNSTPVSWKHGIWQFWKHVSHKTVNCKYEKSLFRIAIEIFSAHFDTNKNYSCQSVVNLIMWDK